MQATKIEDIDEFKSSLGLLPYYFRPVPPNIWEEICNHLINGLNIQLQFRESVPLIRRRKCNSKHFFLWEIPRVKYLKVKITSLQKLISILLTIINKWVEVIIWASVFVLYNEVLFEDEKYCVAKYCDDSSKKNRLDV